VDLEKAKRIEDAYNAPLDEVRLLLFATSMLASILVSGQMWIYSNFPKELLNAPC
jgi:hypothetical protein